VGARPSPLEQVEALERLTALRDAGSVDESTFNEAVARILGR